MFVPLKRVYKAADVARRWQIEPEELKERVQRGLQIYTFRETREDDDGTDIYYCDGPYNDIFAEIGDCTWRDIEGYLFDAKDIEAHQKANPYLLKPRKKNTPSSPAADSEEIPIEQVRNWLRMSPQRFVDSLNDASGPGLITSYEEDFRRFIEQNGYRGSSTVPYFTVSMLARDDLTVHRLDWEEYQQREKEQEKADTSSVEILFPAEVLEVSDIEFQLGEAKKQLADIEGVRRWNKQFLTERAELRKALEAKDARIAKLTAELNSAKGSKGKLKKDLANWQDALSLAVQATAKVLATEEKTKTRKELWPFICAAAGCDPRCGKSLPPCDMISEKQFDTWRIALSPEHVDQADKSDKKGRATYPPNTAGTVAGEQDTAEP